MKRMTKRSSIIAAVTVVGVFAAGGVAFAYWTTSGSNTTTAGVASDVSSNLTVTPSGTISGLYPNGPAQDVSVVVENPSTTAVFVSDVGVTIDSTTAGAACLPGNFTIIDNPSYNGQTLNAGASSGIIAPKQIKMVESGANQDGCKGVSVNLTLTAS